MITVQTMSHVSLLLAFAVTLSLLVGGVTPVSASGGSASDHAAADLGGDGVYAQADDDASASFPGNVTVTRGDEVTIAVSHSDPANVTIGSDDNGFEVTVSVGGSGTTEVVLDTRRTTAADPGEFIEGGSATLHSEPLEEPMQPADYLMRVEIDGVEYDIGTLTVEPRGEYAAESNRAPGAFTPAEYVGGGEEGDANVGPLTGTMTAGSTVARGDYAVVRFEESGLETALNTTDLTGSAAANGLKVNFTQTDPGPNTEPREYVATDTANVTVLPNLEDDAFYVLWNTSGVELENIDARNRYRAALSLTDESGFVGADTTLATTTFDLRRQSVSLSPADDATVYPWDNDTYVVEGRTNRAPNTELEVRLRSADPDAFLLISDTTVREDGSFEATVDLGEASRGTNATLWVREHFAETRQEVRLVAPDPSVEFQNQTANGTTVEVTRAELPEGGFVRLVDDGGEVVGRSDYLEPGRHTAMTAELGTPLFETQRLRAELVYAAADGSYNPGAPAYTPNGGAVVNDSAVVDFPPEPTETPAATETTATATATATRTPTATPYPVATRTPLPPSGATQSTLPLSPAVAVVALLAAAALFARRGESS
ncbi:BGTF surface domain-containing protein [Halobellus ruber]|uniref:DUF7282 domain-containing protein n=1 Tax=Halobellus ruber TaxID=2761102 RepID=A0A7J9SG72_9EURY|nr:BGTF surface domain-containing protein [Halobellus ruber]MBB6645718.1 hypothetical protein [Halobellus ruber]